MSKKACQTTLIMYATRMHKTIFHRENNLCKKVFSLLLIPVKNRAVGVDLFATQNLNAMQDTNRILFCSGMFSFGKTNEFANMIGAEIRTVFENYKDNDVVEVTGATTNSAADEIKKFKDLLDAGVITQEEFDLKKKQLLGL
ncbi:MAG: SHOCT domain-containing protein [Clostridia bacterium]|nr:SHOCT domain-containing protein [Clostridia bacterium]